MEKRAQEMTLGTIILIVLGIAVLVFLIFGFSTGWNNLWDKVTSFVGTSNVDTIRQACALACSSQSSHDYCEQVRTVKFGKEVEIGGKKVKTKDGTCSEMVKNKPNFPGVNIDNCPISC